MEKTLRLWSVGLLAVGLLSLAAALLLYLTPPGAVAKQAETSLVIDYPAALSYLVEPSDVPGALANHEHQVPTGGLQKYEALTHQYRPTKLIVFKGRNYMPLAGSTYRFDGTKAERLELVPTYFLIRDKGDLAAPLTARFQVDWLVQGRARDGSRIRLDGGRFSGRIAERSGTVERKELSGSSRVGLAFDTADAKLRHGDAGWYEILMTARTRYEMEGVRGRAVTGRTDHTIFKAKVNYANGRRGQVDVYYPLKEMTARVALEHPMLLAAKSKAPTVALFALALMALAAGVNTASSRLLVRAVTG